MRRVAAVLLAAALALAVAAPTATMAAAEPKTSLYEIEQQVMCVLCRTPLAIANGPQADAQRAEIRAMIDDGMTADAIKAQLVADYGERVLALPDDEGFNLAVYVVPLAVVALGLALIALLLPRWRRSARARAAQPAAALGPELSADDAKRLEDDLERYD